MRAHSWDSMAWGSAIPADRRNTQKIQIALPGKPRMTRIIHPIAGFWTLSAVLLCSAGHGRAVSTIVRHPASRPNKVVPVAKVALVRCENYEYENVRNAVQKGIDLLGGPSLFARPGEKILFKPNWLVADPPEKLTTTHPMVFKAVVQVFKTTGAILSYGDSPAIQSPEHASRTTGFRPSPRLKESPWRISNREKKSFSRKAGRTRSSSSRTALSIVTASSACQSSRLTGSNA